MQEEVQEIIRERDAARSLATVLHDRLDDLVQATFAYYRYAWPVDTVALRAAVDAGHATLVAAAAAVDAAAEPWRRECGELRVRVAELEAQRFAVCETCGGRERLNTTAVPSCSCGPMSSPQAKPGVVRR